MTTLEIFVINSTPGTTNRIITIIKVKRDNYTGNLDNKFLTYRMLLKEAHENKEAAW